MNFKIYQTNKASNTKNKKKILKKTSFVVVDDDEKFVFACRLIPLSE